MTLPTQAVPQQSGTPQKQQPQAERVTENTVAEIISAVQKFQDSGMLQVPDGYHPENAVRAAWLMLQDMTDKNSAPILSVVSKSSVVNAMHDMVLKGLNPVKKQCYFIAYGSKLTCQPSYQGNVMLAKRDAGVKEVIPHVIYANDEFAFEVDSTTGRKKLVRHTQSLGNIDENNIIGAYAVVVFNDGTSTIDVMTKFQIDKAWAQGPTKGDSPAHKNFPSEMCKKTVSSRSVKNLVNSSSDFEEEPIPVVEETPQFAGRLTEVSVKPVEEKTLQIKAPEEKKAGPF